MISNTPPRPLNWPYSYCGACHPVPGKMGASDDATTNERPKKNTSRTLPENGP